MDFGLYINDDLQCRSSSISECYARGVEYLYTQWSKHKEKTDAMTTLYLNALENLISENGLTAVFEDNTIEVREIEDKKYVVTYEVTFEPNADTSKGDFIARKERYVCYGSKVDKVYHELRRRLENEVENDWADTTLSFDERIGDTIICYEDNDMEYNVTDMHTSKYYTILVEEVQMD